MSRGHVIRSLALGISASLGVSLTSCATTVIAPSDTTVPIAATATTLPTGTPAQLLPRLLVEVGKLSDAIGNNDHKAQQLQTIDNLWNAVRPAVASADGVIVTSFDGMIALCHTGEKVNRPADADKCFRNLTALAGDFLAKHP